MFGYEWRGTSEFEIVSYIVHMNLHENHLLFQKIISKVLLNKKTKDQISGEEDMQYT